MRRAFFLIVQQTSCASAAQSPKLRLSNCIAAAGKRYLRPPQVQHAVTGTSCVRMARAHCHDRWNDVPRPSILFGRPQQPRSELQSNSP